MEVMRFLVQKKANVDEAMENGGQEVVDALVEQLTAYLAST